MRKLRGISFLVGCLFLLCSCKAPKELGESDIVTGIYLDYLKEENCYVLTCEIADFSGYEKGNMVSPKYRTKTGTPLEDVFLAMKEDAEQTLYFAHAGIILLGRGFYEKSLEEEIRFFIQDPDIHPDIRICLEGDSISRMTSYPKECLSQKIKSRLEQAGQEYANQLYRIYSRGENAFYLPVIEWAEDGVCISSSVRFVHSACYVEPPKAGLETCLPKSATNDPSKGVIP